MPPSPRPPPPSSSSSSSSTKNKTLEAPSVSPSRSPPGGASRSSSLTDSAHGNGDGSGTQKKKKKQQQQQQQEEEEKKKRKRSEGGDGEGKDSTVNRGRFEVETSSTLRSSSRSTSTEVAEVTTKSRNKRRSNSQVPMDGSASPADTAAFRTPSRYADRGTTTTTTAASMWTAKPRSVRRSASPPILTKSAARLSPSPSPSSSSSALLYGPCLDFLDASTSLTAGTYAARRLPEIKSLWRALLSSKMDDKKNDDDDDDDCADDDDAWNLRSSGRDRSSRHLRRRGTSHNRRRKHRYPRGDHVHRRRLAVLHDETGEGVKSAKSTSRTREEEEEGMEPGTSKTLDVSRPCRRARRKPSALRWERSAWRRRTNDGERHRGNVCAAGGAINGSIDGNDTRIDGNAATRRHVNLRHPPYWIETHRYHAKRFHCHPSHCGWSVPLMHSNRGAAAALRLASSFSSSFYSVSSLPSPSDALTSEQGGGAAASATVQDATWSIDGTAWLMRSRNMDFLVHALKRVCCGGGVVDTRKSETENFGTIKSFLDDVHVLSGRRIGEGTAHELDAFPLNCIGPIAVLFGTEMEKTRDGDEVVGGLIPKSEVNTETAATTAMATSESKGNDDERMDDANNDGAVSGETTTTTMVHVARIFSHPSIRVRVGQELGRAAHAFAFASASHGTGIVDGPRLHQDGLALLRVRGNGADSAMRKALLPSIPNPMPPSEMVPRRTRNLLEPTDDDDDDDDDDDNYNGDGGDESALIRDALFGPSSVAAAVAAAAAIPDGTVVPARIRPRTSHGIEKGDGWGEVRRNAYDDDDDGGRNVDGTNQFHLGNGSTATGAAKNKSVEVVVTGGDELAPPTSAPSPLPFLLLSFPTKDDDGNGNDVGGGVAYFIRRNPSFVCASSSSWSSSLSLSTSLPSPRAPATIHRCNVPSTGWDVLLHPSLARDAFLSLVHVGRVCPVGMVEEEAASLERDPPAASFPRDYVDTDVGKEFWTSYVYADCDNDKDESEDNSKVGGWGGNEQGKAGSLGRERGKGGGVIGGGWDTVRYCCEEGLRGGRVRGLSKLLRRRSQKRRRQQEVSIGGDDERGGQGVHRDENEYEDEYEDEDEDEDVGGKKGGAVASLGPDGGGGGEVEMATSTTSLTVACRGDDDDDDNDNDNDNNEEKNNDDDVDGEEEEECCGGDEENEKYDSEEEDGHSNESSEGMDDRKVGAGASHPQRGGGAGGGGGTGGVIDWSVYARVPSSDRIGDGDNDGGGGGGDVVVVRGDFGAPFVRAFAGCGRVARSDSSHPAPSSSSRLVVDGNKEKEGGGAENLDLGSRSRRRRRRPRRKVVPPSVPRRVLPLDEPDASAHSGLCSNLASSLSLPALLRCHVTMEGRGTIREGAAIHGWDDRFASSTDRLASEAARTLSSRILPPILGRAVAGAFSPSRGRCHGVAFVGAVRLLNLLASSSTAEKDSSPRRATAARRAEEMAKAVVVAMTARGERRTELRVLVRNANEGSVFRSATMALLL